ncbi:hypothetical protein AB0B25_25310 [Nocardia sp. NPDC049190]|uniref:hypothetical protein n=1 Tax=Nocardia sp. NPDC049190 TaxID=3155650 RepID=UPI0033D68AC7
MGIPRRSIEVPAHAAPDTSGVITARRARGINVIEVIATLFLLFLVAADTGSGSLLASLAIGAILLVVLYIGGRISGGRDDSTSSGAAGHWIAEFTTRLIAAVSTRTVVNRTQGATSAIVGLATARPGTGRPRGDGGRVPRDRNLTDRCEIEHSAVEHSDVAPAGDATPDDTNPDYMPLGRVLAYPDGHRSRVGANRHMHRHDPACMASSHRPPNAGARSHGAYAGRRALRKATVRVAVGRTRRSHRWVASAEPCEPAEPAREAIPLLEPDQLLGAISGNSTCGGSPLIGWARELGDLHAALIPVHLDPARRPTDFDETGIHADIARVVAEIDTWAVFHVARTRTARKNIHSLGEVISHVAHTYAVAWWTVLHTDDEDLRHEAWFHLGEVQEGYAELVDEIRTRRVQLPLGWRGMRGPRST